MASGVQVSDECKDKYQEVKMNLAGKKKSRYAVFKISDDLKKIVIDDERVDAGDEDQEVQQCQQEGNRPFEELIKGLPTDDGRYIVYDYPYQGSFGSSSKVILVMWVPSNISIKKKMLYASSKDSLKRCFPDCGGEFQADCCEDLCHRDIEQKLRKV